MANPPKRSCAQRSNKSSRLNTEAQPNQAGLFYCYAKLVLARRILSADIVYSGLGTARAGGAVVLQGDGDDTQIVAIDTLEVVKQNFPEATLEHIGFAISPTPANAHTHLNLSSMPHTPGRYANFIRQVIDYHRSKEDGFLEDAQQGLQEIREGGIDTIGDIVRDEEIMHHLLTHPELQGVAYWEVVAPNPKDADTVFAATVERLQRFRSWERPGGVKLGLSPHTPHTVSAPLLKRLAALAQGSRLPMQIHVAESPAEILWHRDGSGPLAALLGPFVPDWRPSGLSPVKYLEQLGVLAAQPTLVHMVNVAEDDIRTAHRAGCITIHCPRSNEALGCGRFPWKTFMKLGAEVGFGSDSKGSSPSLSVVDEVHAAIQLHGERANPLALVRAAVKGSHRALGLTPPQIRRGDPAAKLFLWPSPTPPEKRAL